MARRVVARAESRGVLGTIVPIFVAVVVHAMGEAIDVPIVTLVGDAPGRRGSRDGAIHVDVSPVDVAADRIGLRGHRRGTASASTFGAKPRTSGHVHGAIRGTVVAVSATIILGIVTNGRVGLVRRGTIVGDPTPVRGASIAMAVIPIVIGARNEMLLAVSVLGTVVDGTHLVHPPIDDRIAHGARAIGDATRHPVLVRRDGEDPIHLRGTPTTRRIAFIPTSPRV